jgi:outer membrane protein assembly factor BamB/ankyrin repeat protein
MLLYTAAATLLTVLCWSDAGRADLNEALLQAAKSGDAKAVAALLTKGADVNAKTAYGATALAFAADKGYTEVARVLIQHKADVNAKDSFYQATPVFWAIDHGHAGIVKLLIEADVKDAAGALRTAAILGKVDVVRAIIETGKVKGVGLNNALTATPENAPEIAELLKKAGAKGTPKTKSDPAVAEALKAAVGQYRSAKGLKVTLSSTGSSLTAVLGEQKIVALAAVGENDFRSNEAEVSISLRRTDSNVSGLWLRQGRTETAYKRVEDAKLVVASDPIGKVARSGNWPQFRGTAASGVADGQLPPTAWDATKGDNVRWKTPIPGMGHACPIVWGDPNANLRPGSYGDVDSVNDTTEHTWLVLCLDKWSGRVLWERTAYKGIPKVKRHLKSTQANPTPVTDGNCVVALFGSEGMYCYDFEGNLRWKSDLGVLTSGWFYDRDYEWGFGSSPIIYHGKVIVQCDTGKNSFLAAFDLRDGKQVWRTPREEIPSWGTPTVVEAPGHTELVTNATKFVRGYDPETGRELWRLGRNAEITVPTPIYGQGLIYVTSGYRPIQPIYAIRPGASGDLSLKDGKTESANIAWSTTRNGPYMPTPILYGEHLYTCPNSGLVTCYEAKTGKQVYRERLGGSATYTGSPVAADGRLYFTSEEHGVTVVKAGPKFEKLAVNPIGEVCMATPAISDGMIFVRGQHHLFALGRPNLVKGPSGTVVK